MAQRAESEPTLWARMSLINLLNFPSHHFTDWEVPAIKDKRLPSSARRKKRKAQIE